MHEIKMKILLSIPGHLKTVPMSKYIFQTLGEMGCEVTVFNYGVHGAYPKLLKAFSKNSFLNYSDKKLIQIVSRVKPDLFITVFGFDHRKEVIDQIKWKGIKTICWWLNDPFQIKRSIAQAGFYDYYFTNSKGSIKSYHDANIKKIFYLPVGSFPKVHRKLNISNFEYEISFAGDWSSLREKMLLDLSKDFNISIFGPWKKKLNKNSPLSKNVIEDGAFTPEEMVKIFNSSKIVLNIHTWFGQWNYGINPRVFEANGCGAFQISDYKEEIPEMYEPEKEIVLYASISELKDKLSYFLQHSEKASEIAEQGFLKTIKHHTYKQRLKKMFSVAGIE